MASRQDDPRIKRVRFEDKHLSLVTLKENNVNINLWSECMVLNLNAKTHAKEKKRKETQNNYFKNM